MAKITLGKRPVSFKRTITFKMVDGSPGSFEVDYQYRTRTEFAEFADQIRADMKARIDAERADLKKLVEQKLPIPDVTQAEILARETAANVDYVMGCIKDWNLDVPLDKAAVEQMADELPAAITEIVATYRDAITEGRSGN